MIETVTQTANDCDQLGRKELARGAWREGRIADALLIIRSVLAEEMSPHVAAECYSAEACFLADAGDFAGSLESLWKMAPFLEAASVRVQGTFFLQRGRVYKNLGNIDEALTDYSGSLALWQACGDKNYEGAASINLAGIYLLIGDLVQARKNIEYALATLPPGSVYWPDAYDTKAQVLLAEGSLALALSFIEKALGLIGDNEAKRLEFLETQSKIKDRLMDLLIPLVSFVDLDDLKIQVVRNALDKAGGSITLAADMIKTSHQVVAYTARKHGLERSAPRKKHIIKK